MLMKKSCHSNKGKTDRKTTMATLLVEPHIVLVVDTNILSSLPSSSATVVSFTRYYVRIPEVLP